MALVTSGLSTGYIFAIGQLLRREELTELYHSFESVHVHNINTGTLTKAIAKTASLQIPLVQTTIPEPNVMIIVEVAPQFNQIVVAEKIIALKTGQLPVIVISMM